MKKLLGYLKGYYKESIIAPLFKCLEACFELYVPVVTARIIDIGIKNQDKSYIMAQCALLITLGIVGFVCATSAQYFAAKAGMGFGANIRKDLFHRINEFDYAALDKAGTSTLVTRITGDVNQIQTGINLFLRLFMRVPIIVIGAVIMASLISPGMTLLFAAAMILISLAIFFIVRFTVFTYKKVQGLLDKVVLHTRENYNGVRVVRAFTREKEEQNLFEGTNEDLKDMQIKAGRIQGLLNPITYTIANIGIIVILYLGAFKVNIGSLSQGEVVALTDYMTKILLALLVMVNLIVNVTKATASALRVSEILHIEPEMKEGKEKPGLRGDTQDIIRFQNVSFTYPGGKAPSVEGINFSIRQGETIGIIGGTGAGKSTLINLIPRFYDATSGEVIVSGGDVKRYTYKSLRKMIGIVPQKSVLFSGTIRDNMKWRKDDASDEEISSALHIAQASEVVDHKKGGLDAYVAPGGTNFSGGQRQRLCIARALVGNPGVLLMDDSASALDYATDAALRKALRQSSGIRTTVIVSQRVATVMSADKIVVLDHGHMAGIGTHRELLKSSTVYQEICLSQFSKEEVLRYV